MQAAVAACRRCSSSTTFASSPSSGTPPHPGRSPGRHEPVSTGPAGRRGSAPDRASTTDSGWPTPHPPGPAAAPIAAGPTANRPGRDAPLGAADLRALRISAGSVRSRSLRGRREPPRDCPRRRLVPAHRALRRLCTVIQREVSSPWALSSSWVVVEAFPADPASGSWPVAGQTLHQVEELPPFSVTRQPYGGYLPGEPLFLPSRPWLRSSSCTDPVTGVDTMAAASAPVSSHRPAPADGREGARGQGDDDLDDRVPPGRPARRRSWASLRISELEPDVAVEDPPGGVVEVLRCGGQRPERTDVAVPGGGPPQPPYVLKAQRVHPLTASGGPGRPRRPAGRLAGMSATARDRPRSRRWSAPRGPPAAPHVVDCPRGERVTAQRVCQG